MTNKPIAYTGLFLVLAGFLLVVGLVAFGGAVEWLRDSREGIAWGAFALCIVGTAFGAVNWRTAPGKVAACFGGLLVLLFLVTLLSTGHSPSDRQAPASPSTQVPTPQQTAKTAAETIQKMWRDHLHLKSNTAKLNEVVESENVLAKLQTFKECFKRIKGTLRPQERKTAILYGSMEDLNREGNCWEVTIRDNEPSYRSHGNLVGYIDLRGEVVLIWDVPEG